MNKIKIALISLFLVSLNVNADVVGFKAGINAWSADIAGTVRDSNSALDQVDLKTDLNLADSGQSGFFVQFEHPVPLVPNIRVTGTELVYNGSGDASKSFTFNGQTYTGTVDITTELDLSHTDALLFWDILDNDLVGLDIGINVRLFDGDVKLTSSEGNVNEVFDSTVPMLYGALEIGIPGTDFFVGGELSTLSVEDDEITDTNLFIRYSGTFYGVDLGYRKFEIDVDDTANLADPTKANITFDGYYANLFLEF